MAKRLVLFWIAALPVLTVVHFRADAAEWPLPMREVVETILANGTIPVLTTAPPFHGFERDAADFAAAMRNLANDLAIPLIDYHAEILARNPGDTWDGSLVYEDGSVYEVERLVAGDGFHPSNPAAYRNNFSEEALDRSGFTLRNYMTLLALYDVYNLVIDFPSGDFSSDGVVNRQDLSVWRKSAGAFPGAMQSLGNADGDGDVDGDDLLELLLQFGDGQRAISGTLLASAPSAAGATSVPEPQGQNLALVLLGIVMAAALAHPVCRRP